jgi:hypothetical protein
LCIACRKATTSGRYGKQEGLRFVLLEILLKWGAGNNGKTFCETILRVTWVSASLFNLRSQALKMCDLAPQSGEIRFAVAHFRGSKGY